MVDAAYIDRFQVRQEFYVKKSAPESQAISIRVPHPAGVLYRRILNLYKNLQGQYGWARDYYLSILAHCVADLSMPGHNCPRGDNPAGDGKVYPEFGHWASSNHQKFDTVLDSWLVLTPDKRQQLEARLTPLTLSSTSQLANEVARIANTSIALANKCYREGRRTMTRDEALMQAARSVSLLRAIVDTTKPQ